MQQTNFATLGFVAANRRPAFRDSYFTGSSGNPSKKTSPPMNLTARRPDDATAAAVPPPPAAAPRSEAPAVGITADAVLERRCHYLEAQEKRHGNELSELTTKLSVCEEDLRQSQTQSARLIDALRASVAEHAHQVKATAAVDVTEYEADAADEVEGGNGKVAAPTDAAVCGTVRAGERVRLQYPMTKSDCDIWMRRRRVHTLTGQLSWSWVRVAREEPTDDGGVPRTVVYFRDFA